MDRELTGQFPAFPERDAGSQSSSGQKLPVRLLDELQDRAYNTYTKTDVTTPKPQNVERVFISHHSVDKSIAVAVAKLLGEAGIHYWFDRDDEDTQRAAALGMRGDQALIHAIDRGIRHSTRILGILTENTRRSWWVPYEIGSARAAGIPTSFLILESLNPELVPEFIRLCSLYCSIDELLRWVTSLAGGHLHCPTNDLFRLAHDSLQSIVPALPPEPSIQRLSQRAVAAINQLFDVETQRLLQLTSTHFDWLSTTGGFVRDISYDIFAPLAFYQFNETRFEDTLRLPLRLLYLSISQHNALACIEPKLLYEPVTPGWRTLRYTSPASHWLQGMSPDQLKSRLNHFFIVTGSDGSKRLATKEEFKDEFDRLLRNSWETDRQIMGVLVNPIRGFNVRDRPVFCRILAIQLQIYQRILQQRIPTMADVYITSFAERYISNASKDGELSNESIDHYLQITRVERKTRPSEISH